VRIPSFGPGQLKGIPALDFEAVVIEPLDQTASVEGGREGVKEGAKGKSKGEDCRVAVRTKDPTAGKDQRHGGDLKGISSK